MKTKRTEIHEVELGAIRAVIEYVNGECTLSLVDEEKRISVAVSAEQRSELIEALSVGWGLDKPPGVR